MAREARDRERNTRDEAIIRINNDMNDMRKDMERDWDESGVAGATFASTRSRDAGSLTILTR